MAGKPKYTPEQVIAAITETKGMLTLTARKLGCDYNTVRAYIDRHESVKTAYQDAHEQMGDAVELALYDEAVNKRTPAALIFLAKTKFKSRGYIERTEITGKDGDAIRIDVSQMTDDELRAIAES